MRNFIFALASFMLLLYCGCKKDDVIVLPPVQIEPLVSITSIKNGDKLSDTVFVAIEAADDKAVNKVELYIDNKTDSAKTLTARPYLYKWDTCQLEDSSTHTIFAKAYDADGNIGITPVLNVTTSKFQPTGLIFRIYSDSTVWLNWKDNCLFETGFEIEYAGSNSYYSLIAKAEKDAEEISWATDFSRDTLYQFRIRAVSEGRKSNWNYSAVRGGCGNIKTVAYEGSIYHTVQIGARCWLKENLDVGDMILGKQEQTNNGHIEKYCYNDIPSNCTKYGGLYQWAEAVQYQNGATNLDSPVPDFSTHVRGICPPGWHLPSHAEHRLLYAEVKENTNGLKEIGQGYGIGAGTNSTGFSALLSGVHTTGGGFTGYFYFTSFWSLSEYNTKSAYDFSLYNNRNSYSLYYSDKVSGRSIRCLKD